MNDILNGCLDDYEVKADIGIFKYIFKYVSGKGKPNLPISEIFSFFNGL